MSCKISFVLEDDYICLHPLFFERGKAFPQPQNTLSEHIKTNPLFTQVFITLQCHFALFNTTKKWTAKQSLSLLNVQIIIWDGEIWNPDLLERLNPSHRQTQENPPPPEQGKWIAQVTWPENKHLTPWLPASHVCRVQGDGDAGVSCCLPSAPWCGEHVTEARRHTLSSQLWLTGTHLAVWPAALSVHQKRAGCFFCLCLCVLSCAREVNMLLTDLELSPDTAFALIPERHLGLGVRGHDLDKPTW